MKKKKKNKTMGPPNLLAAITTKLEEDKGGMPRVFNVAEQFIRQAEKGSFAHAKEILDRQEGRVATKVEDAEGKPLKMYIGIPVEGRDAP